MHRKSRINVLGNVFVVADSKIPKTTPGADCAGEKLVGAETSHSLVYFFATFFFILLSFGGPCSLIIINC